MQSPAINHSWQTRHVVRLARFSAHVRHLRRRAENGEKNMAVQCPQIHLSERADHNLFDWNSDIVYPIHQFLRTHINEKTMSVKFPRHPLLEELIPTRQGPYLPLALISHFRPTLGEIRALAAKSPHPCATNAGRVGSRWSKLTRRAKKVSSKAHHSEAQEFVITKPNFETVYLQADSDLFQLEESKNCIVVEVLGNRNSATMQTQDETESLDYGFHSSVDLETPWMGFLLDPEGKHSAEKICINMTQRLSTVILSRDWYLKNRTVFLDLKPLEKWTKVFSDSTDLLLHTFDRIIPSLFIYNLRNVQLLRTSHDLHWYNNQYFGDVVNHVRRYIFCHALLPCQYAILTPAGKEWKLHALYLSGFTIHVLSTGEIKVAEDLDFPSSHLISSGALDHDLRKFCTRSLFAKFSYPSHRIIPIQLGSSRGRSERNIVRGTF